MKLIDLTNQKFGKLLVLEKAITQNEKVMWKCLCDCGNIVIVKGVNLKNNRTKSCGCLKKELIVNRSTKHNQRHTKLYEVWKTMKQRCYNPNNKSFKNYGGRCISICEEWKNNFTAFYNWSMQNGYEENLSIDRINNNGNYEPSICRWTTRIVQQNNTRNNRYITINNETKTLSQWCSFYNIKYTTVASRLQKGYNEIDALTMKS